MRIIVMCGKGGVGKSTLAAALGLRASRLGQRTLVFSIDPAHTLGATFGVTLAHSPTPVAPSLWAAELEPIEEVDAHWAEAKAYMASLLASQGVEASLGAEIASLPGVSEVAALVQLKRLVTAGQFDTIVLDSAPTAFALRLLSLPEISRWYAKQILRLAERHGPQLMLLAPVVGAQLPLPPGHVVKQFLALLDELKELPVLLADPAVTSTRLVMRPDRPSLDEARRNYRYLSLYGLAVDGVVVNGVLPAVVTDPFFAPRRRVEAEVLAAARADFAPLPVFEVPLRPEELIGEGALADLGEALWPGETDPAAALSDERPVSIEAEGEAIQVAFKLPFTSAKDVDLSKLEDELHLTVGEHRRTLILPAEAAGLQPVKAKFQDGKLLVTLAGAAP